MEPWTARALRDSITSRVQPRQPGPGSSRPGPGTTRLNGVVCAANPRRQPVRRTPGTARERASAPSTRSPPRPEPAKPHAQATPANPETTAHQLPPDTAPPTLPRFPVHPTTSPPTTRATSHALSSRAAAVDSTRPSRAGGLCWYRAGPADGDQTDHRSPRDPIERVGGEWVRGRSFWVH